MNDYCAGCRHADATGREPRQVHASFHTCQLGRRGRVALPGAENELDAPAVLAERLWHGLRDDVRAEPRDIAAVIMARDIQWRATLRKATEKMRRGGLTEENFCEYMDAVAPGWRTP